MKKVSLTISQIKKQKDITKISKIIRQKRNSDLIIFPEAVIQTSDLSILKKLQQFSIRYKTSIIIGVIHESKGKLYNYAYFISPKKIERYQKTHVHWTEKYIPGKSLKVIETPFGKIGLLICYDAAFDETAKVLALMGAELICIISATPNQFHHRHNTLRARGLAHFNQVFVINCQLTGKSFTGHSVIVDPVGDLLAELGKSEKILTRTIDFGKMRSWRKEERIFPYRKPNLYKKIAY